MNYYLIDYENVKIVDFECFGDINESDMLALFYSERCKSINIGVMEEVSKLKLEFKSFKVQTGTKNALDFQLSSYLGFLIGRHGVNSKYYIVSKDKGYDCLCGYWEKQKISVERISPELPSKKSAVAPKPTKKKSKVNSKDLATITEIESVVSSTEESKEVLEIFNQYKTKQAICNGLAKKYKDSKKASEIYKKLKPLLKQKNKS